MADNTKRTKLTSHEFNLVADWFHRVKMDEVIDIVEMDDKEDKFIDFENDKTLSLSEGFTEMADAVAYRFEHEGFSKDEADIFFALFEEFDVDKNQIAHIRSLVE